MQWVDEVHDKAPGLSVALYHGPGRADRLPPVLLASHDIIITTYNTVSTSMCQYNVLSVVCLEDHRESQLPMIQDLRRP